MKRRLFIVLCAASILSANVVYGASRESQTQEQEQAQTEQAQTEQAQTEQAQTEQAQTEEDESKQEEPQYKWIGEKSQEGYHPVIKNLTNMNITEILIKARDDTRYSENLLEEKDIWLKEEERILYVNPAEDEENSQEGTEADSAREDSAKIYDLQLVFGENDLILNLHAFPFEDLEKADLYALDGVPYLVYTSKDTKEEINTKASELEIVAQEQAAAQVQTYEEPYYEEPYYQEPSYSYDVPVYDPPVYYEPVPEQPAVGGGDGCINNGLVW